MRPKTLPRTSADDLFRARLEAILDGRHELVRLARLIDWQRFETAFGSLYVEHKGRPGLPTRLMVGLHLLQHAKGLSDEAVCALWLENPYMQFFCGETYFQHKLPLERSSMSRWRGRIGADKLEELLAETLAAARRTKAVDTRQVGAGHDRHHGPDQGDRPSHRHSPAFEVGGVAEPVRPAPWYRASPVLRAAGGQGPT